MFCHNFITIYNFVKILHTHKIQSLKFKLVDNNLNKNECFIFCNIFHSEGIFY